MQSEQLESLRQRVTEARGFDASYNEEDDTFSLMWDVAPGELFALHIRGDGRAVISNVGKGKANPSFYREIKPQEIIDALLAALLSEAAP